KARRSCRDRCGSTTWPCAARRPRIDPGRRRQYHGNQGNPMKKPLSVLPLYGALAAMLAVSQPLAQTAEGVARLKNVHGNVLVSKESGLASGDEALRLTKGTRVITTANAEVIVAYDDGCEVRLKENQRFEVETDKPCAALVAQAQS